MSGKVKLLIPLLLLAAALIVWVIWGPAPGEFHFPLEAAAAIALLALFAALEFRLEGFFGAWMETLIILAFVAILMILFYFSPVFGVMGVFVLLAIILLVTGR